MNQRIFLLMGMIVLIAIISACSNNTSHDGQENNTGSKTASGQVSNALEEAKESSISSPVTESKNSADHEGNRRAQGETNIENNQTTSNSDEEAQSSNSDTTTQSTDSPDHESNRSTTEETNTNNKQTTSNSNEDVQTSNSSNDKDETIHITNGKEAIAYLRANIELGDNEDVIFDDMGGFLEEDESGSYYTVTLFSKSLQESGGSGTLESYKVYIDGKFELK